MRSISRSNGSQAYSFRTKAMSVSDSASRRCRAITDADDREDETQAVYVIEQLAWERVVVGSGDGW